MEETKWEKEEEEMEMSEGEESSGGNSSLPEQEVRPSKRQCVKGVEPGIATNTDYGRLVWGKITGWKEWPGVVVCHSDCGKRPPAPDSAWVFWFSDYRVSEVFLNNVVDFRDKPLPPKLNKSLQGAILECLEEVRSQSSLPKMASDALLEWGSTGFPGAQAFTPHPESCLSSKIMQKLWKIQMMVKKQPITFPTSSSDSSSRDSNPSDAEERRSWKPKASLLNKVRSGECDLETLCIACSRVDCQVAAPHPIFFGGICEDCQVDFEDALQERGDDNIHCYCTVCGSPGELLICDSADCDRVYCVGCVELLVSPAAVKTIKKTNPWTCFLCTPHHPDTHGLLSPRASQAGGVTWDEEPELDPASFPGQPLRVLSLFDGIATGLYVLEKLGLEVEVYYASEINDSAIRIAEFNHRSKITSIGNVEQLTKQQIARMCPIDLLVGGSPCNDLSFVNPKRKGLIDPTGSGVLFFYYYRTLKEIQLCNQDRPLFWLFENVVHMAKVDSDYISLFLNCKPALVDARHFSPQHRPRHFWGNLPGMYRPVPLDLGSNIHLSHCLDKIGDRSALVEKVNCITTNPASLKLANGAKYPVSMDQRGDTPWITEIEKIFGFPPHYTDVGNIQVRERQALLGRSWSVQVIEHLLKPLAKYYPTPTVDTPATLAKNSASTTIKNSVVTCESTGTQNRDPTTQSQDPSIQNQDPTAQSQDPTTQNQDPTTQNQDPTTQNQDPTTQSQGPSTQSQDPTTQKQNPTTQNQDPSTQNQDPTTQNQNPTTQNQNPTTWNQDPTTQNQDPATQNQDPITQNQDPTTQNQDPTTRNQDLTTQNQNPTTQNQDPTTRNQDPTTRNQDPTTQNQNPTTQNQDPTTRNQDPTTQNQDPTTRNQDPTTQNQDPTFKNQNPKIQNQDPTTQNQDPTSKNQDPTSKNQDPTTQNQDPTSKNQDPTTQNQDPTSKNQDPTTQNQDPTFKNQNPKIQNQDPTSKNQDPTTQNQDPTSKNQDPTTQNQDPTSKNQDPTSKNQDPTSKNQDPTSKNQDPSSKNQDPTTQSQDPTSKNQDPASKNQDPASKNQDPTSKNQDPASKNQDPTSKNQDPASKNQDPASKNQDPTSKNQDPTSKNQDPTSKNQDPASKNQDPTSKNQDPTSKNQDPTSKNQDPTSKNQDPTTQNQDPISKNQDPTSKNQDPTSKNQDPTIQNQDPTSKNQDPTSKNQDPTTQNQVIQ